MAISHILFDLDNTLYPSSAGILQLFDERISNFVQRFLDTDEQTARQLQHDYYTTYGTTLRGLQAKYGEKVDVEEYLRYVHDLELSAILSVDAELDRRLKEIRSRKSIFTNSPIEHAQRVLKMLGIEQHFDHIFDIRFHAFDPKPSVATYHRVLGTLGLSGEETVFLEDSPQNLGPARSLGMTTILLSDTPAHTLNGIADYIVPDIFAALNVVQELEGAG